MSCVILVSKTCPRGADMHPCGFFFKTNYFFINLKTIIIIVSLQNPFPSKPISPISVKTQERQDGEDEIGEGLGKG